MFEDFGEPWAGACCYLDESPLWGAIKIKSKRHNYPLILMMVSWTGYSGGWLETGQACSGTAGSTSKKCSSLHVAILHDIFYFQKTSYYVLQVRAYSWLGLGSFRHNFLGEKLGKGRGPVWFDQNHKIGVYLQVILKEGLEKIQDYPDPVWVLLFPEGTRYTKEKYLAGKEFSESRGKPVLKHCLVPRTKGWSFTVANLEAESIPWVYDVTLFCEASPPPTLTSVLLGRAAKAHMYIRRFKLEEIPKSEVGSAAWLQDLFVTKDALLESFHSKGSFDGVEGCPVHPPVVLPPRHFSLLVAVGVNLAVLYPLCKVLLSCGPWGLAFTAVGFAAASAGIKYFLGLTQVGSFDLAWW